ncbi:Gamma-interferon-responsive lysosomal thiol protein isoform B [Glycine soja]|uniref:Gamma-interferon-responsive lysosomal thiol protein isoform B n=1 Tax=Glycine soja TaxID=3848 RepID=A0A445M2B8_GLYSO|nr:Gamma-interferon-responsive lysosomal thiol protein isoform B [Glycine soja]
MKMRPFLRSFPRSLIFFFGCFLLLPLLLLLLVAPSSSGAPNEKVQHFRFVRCLERLILEGRHNQWVNCFQMTGLGTSPIDCYTNGNGKAIDQKYAKETAQLNPPHRFVPWVVVNNQALQEDYQNFVTYICRAYKGNVIPNACRSLSTRTNDSNEKVNSFLPVCYVDEARNLTLPLVITRLLTSLVASISHLLSHHYSRAKGRVFEDFATCKEGNSLGEVSKAAKENEVFFILWRLQSSLFLLHSVAISLQEAKDSIDEEDARLTSSAMSYIMWYQEHLRLGSIIFSHNLLVLNL